MIDNSNVSFSATAANIYKVNSEGTLIKSTMILYTLHSSAMCTTPEGEHFGDQISVTKTSLADLPSVEEFTKSIKSLAERMINYRNSELLKVRYNGPVMYEGGAVAGILNGLILGGGVIGSRPQEGAQISGESFSRRIGELVVDPRITVKNYTTLKEYNGEKLLGSYEIDADGVKPAAEMTLIEAGKVKSIINTRYPTVGAEESTGSNRWALTQRGIASFTSPGTVHYQITKGTKQSAMKKALIKLAKKNKNEYAYIVRSGNAGMPMIYQVDLKSGAETLLRGATMDGLDISDLKEIAKISSEEVVSSSLAGGVMVSYIVPKSIIIEDADILKKGDVKTKVMHLKSPLQR